ncbi:hypothetical protein GCM10010441_43710 [Kitasatospora paracochleata]
MLAFAVVDHDSGPAEADPEPFQGPLRRAAARGGSPVGHPAEMEISYRSDAEFAAALRRAAEAHHEYEQRTGEPDPDWADWYARFLVDEQAAGRPRATDAPD